MTDETMLIASLKRGDPTAFASAFERYANRLYRLAVGLLADEQQADAVVQETFLALIKHIDSFEGRASLGTWLYRVAYNKAMATLRKRAPLQDINDDDEDIMPNCFVDWDNVPERVLDTQEARAMIDNAVQTLSPALSAVFILRDVEELSIKETAESLGISTATVKVRLHRARLTLRERLTIYFQDATIATD
ncbi:MAG: sigma-70 family RNA polymerase sigma factor [Chloroflexota bacterium]